jgi:hypothetical protein
MINFATFIKTKAVYVGSLFVSSIIGGLMAGIVMASIPDSNGYIHSCTLNTTGAVRIIDSASQSCTGAETALNWSQSSGNNGLSFTCPGCNLTYEGSRLAGKDLSSADLANALMSSIDLSGTNFSNAILAAVNLGGSNLTNANLSNVDLTGSSENNSNLSGVNFTNANLTNAYLAGATNMDTATLTGVTWSNTICPDNVNSNDNGGDCAGHLTP